MKNVLKKGDKVGIVSMCSFLSDINIINSGIDYLKKLGLKPVCSAHIFDIDRYMAGTPKNRAQDLMDFYKDSEIKAVFETQGGAGSQTILPLLDYDIIRENPKPIIGFSDITTLQNAVYAQTNNCSLSGFLLKYDFKSGKIDSVVKSSLEKCLFSHERNIINCGETMNNGTAEGPLIGGNLSSFRNLFGTAYMPKLEGTILLFEDVAEEPYKIELMLTQLQQQKGFDKVKGIIFGIFDKCTASNPADGTIEDVLNCFSAQNQGIPIIKNFLYGHIPSRYVMPIGEKVLISAKDGNTEVRIFQ